MDDTQRARATSASDTFAAPRTGLSLDFAGRIEERLSGDDWSRYRSLAPELLHRWLGSTGDLGQRLALGWTEEGQPRAFALANVSPETGASRLVWLWVRSEDRQHGLGALLLERLEQRARELGCEFMCFKFETGKLDEELRRLFERRAWTPGTPLRIYDFKDPAIARAPWIRRSRLPEDFQVVPWTQLRTAEREELESAEEAGTKARLLDGLISPLRAGDDVLEDVSFWLRRGERVAGWVAVHRRDETAHFTVLNVRPSICRPGRIMPVLARSIEQVVALVQEGRLRGGRFEVLASNEPMVRFAERRLKPWGFCAEVERFETTLGS
ncbi:MAG: GNAT family N-acetyltransferase [Acidobacteriota bacterium]